MNNREERIARNEAIAREINQGLERSQADRSGTVRLLCECGDVDCERVIAITLEEYEHVRRVSTHFAVVKSHVSPDVERIVEETDRFVVVQKNPGVPAGVARRESLRA